ncbi:hypothetical protein ILUMI_04858 [Ignelater luminosus]|uniref:Uncharacterized protein n=1 Tax=Ignelater luminosus TaxID=2038154 RepID=A0A8K0D8D4_IGNLU|nr:hypothetical protein ILUMI_04858 [Ignelater luminosus]
MASKIESLYEQFEKRKEHQTKMEQQIELERQLAQAQIEKAQLELKAEQELWTQERNELHEKCQKSEENCAQLQQTIKTLQDNLELYSGKYQEFKSSISKSNQVFDDCKSEMAKMTKQIITLEKEVKTWRHRSQKNAQSVIELSAIKETQDAKLEAADKKLEQMQKLCRQLQVDRSAYLKLLKANSIEPTSQTCLDEQNIITQSNQQQLTKKEKHLEQLKDNLKVLQNKLTDMQHQAALETLEKLPTQIDECPESNTVENTALEDNSTEETS